MVPRTGSYLQSLIPVRVSSCIVIQLGYPRPQRRCQSLSTAISSKSEGHQHDHRDPFDAMSIVIVTTTVIITAASGSIPRLRWLKVQQGKSSGAMTMRVPTAL